MIKTALFLLIISGLMGCDKENGVKTTDLELLNTSWDWVQTDGGIGNHIHFSPATTGNSIQMKFTQDMKLVIIENDVQIFSADYELTKEKSIYSGEMEDFIKIVGDHDLDRPGGLIPGGIISLDNNTLVISDNIYDGLKSTFERID